MQVSVLLVPSDQGLPQLMGQTLPSLVFISKVLLEYDHTYLLPIVYDCFHSHIFMYLGLKKTCLILKSELTTVSDNSINLERNYKNGNKET